jgi:competence protein ComEA
MLKTIVTGYLSFTRKERTGIIVLLLVIIGATALPFLYPLFKSKRVTAAPTQDEMAALSLKEKDSSRYANHTYARENNNYTNYRNNKTAPPAGELFYFDPNTASEADWKRLGLRDKTIATIQNYLSKGGHFYQPEDIGKIWGLHDDEVERLLPYVRIAAKTNADKYNRPATFEKKEYAYEKKPTTFDINLSDTSAFIALPGIGSKLAGRIVAFRDKLGGFYSVNQIAETYGLADSVFQKIKSRLVLGQPHVALLNINTATLEQLKQHPYIRYQLANAIVQYRAQHGTFAKVEDLKKIMLVTEDAFGKMAPYLTVQ